MNSNVAIFRSTNPFLSSLLFQPQQELSDSLFSAAFDPASWPAVKTVETPPSLSPAATFFCDSYPSMLRRLDVPLLHLGNIYCLKCSGRITQTLSVRNWFFFPSSPCCTVYYPLMPRVLDDVSLTLVLRVFSFPSTPQSSPPGLCLPVDKSPQSGVLSKQTVHPLLLFSPPVCLVSVMGHCAPTTFLCALPP